jgi:uncharacterized membrane protein YhaH (DUF805 family)
MSVLIFLLVFLFPLFFIFHAPQRGANRFGSRGQPMSLTKAIGSYFRNYVNFRDRASRSEFWFSLLFVFIVSIVLSIALPPLSLVWAPVTIVPNIAVAVRRFHDVNRSGWHYLLLLLFPIGTIAVIVWFCRRPVGETSADGTPVNIAAVFE